MRCQSDLWSYEPSYTKPPECRAVRLLNEAARSVSFNLKSACALDVEEDIESTSEQALWRNAPNPLPDSSTSSFNSRRPRRSSSTSHIIQLESLLNKEALKTALGPWGGAQGGHDDDDRGSSEDEGSVDEASVDEGNTGWGHRYGGHGSRRHEACSADAHSFFAEARMVASEPTLGLHEKQLSQGLSAVSLSPCSDAEHESGPSVCKRESGPLTYERESGPYICKQDSGPRALRFRMSMEAGEVREAFAGSDSSNGLDCTEFGKHSLAVNHRSYSMKERSQSSSPEDGGGNSSMLPGGQNHSPPKGGAGQHIDTHLIHGMRETQAVCHRGAGPRGDSIRPRPSEGGLMTKSVMSDPSLSVALAWQPHRNTNTWIPGQKSMGRGCQDFLQGLQAATLPASMSPCASITTPSRSEMPDLSRKSNVPVLPPLGRASSNPRGRHAHVTQSWPVTGSTSPAAAVVAACNELSNTNSPPTSLLPRTIPQPGSAAPCPPKVQRSASYTGHGRFSRDASPVPDRARGSWSGEEAGGRSGGAAAAALESTPPLYKSPSPVLGRRSLPHDLAYPPEGSPPACPPGATPPPAPRPLPPPYAPTEGLRSSVRNASPSRCPLPMGVGGSPVALGNKANFRDGPRNRLMRRSSGTMSSQKLSPEGSAHSPLPTTWSDAASSVSIPSAQCSTSESGRTVHDHTPHMAQPPVPKALPMHRLHEPSPARPSPCETLSSKNARARTDSPTKRIILGSPNLPSRGMKDSHCSNAMRRPVGREGSYPSRDFSPGPSSHAHPLTQELSSGVACCDAPEPSHPVLSERLMRELTRRTTAAPPVGGSAARTECGEPQQGAKRSMVEMPKLASGNVFMHPQGFDLVLD